MRLIFSIFILGLILIPFRSKPYKTPELTAREVYEIRGKWSAQLRELNPEPQEIDVRIKHNSEIGFN